MEQRTEEKMEAMRAEMRAEIAAAQLGVAEGGTALASAVRGIVARLTETPCLPDVLKKTGELLAHKGASPHIDIRIRIAPGHAQSRARREPQHLRHRPNRREHRNRKVRPRTSASSPRTV